MTPAFDREIGPPHLIYYRRPVCPVAAFYASARAPRRARARGIDSCPFQLSGLVYGSMGNPGAAVSSDTAHARPKEIQLAQPRRKRPPHPGIECRLSACGLCLDAGGTGRAAVFKRGDTDLDGMITPEEFENGLKAIFAPFDANADGRLTRSEIQQKLSVARQAGRPQRGGQEPLIPQREHWPG